MSAPETSRCRSRCPQYPWPMKSEPISDADLYTLRQILDTDLEDIDRKFFGQLIARIDDQSAEIARHHADFERWEAMADKGAKQLAVVEAAKEWVAAERALGSVAYIDMSVPLHDRRMAAHRIIEAIDALAALNTTPDQTPEDG